MPDYHDLMKNFTSDAAPRLRRRTSELAAALGVPEEDVKSRELIGEALAKAYMDGAMAGQSEVAAQAIEQGAAVEVDQLRAPDEDGVVRRPCCQTRCQSALIRERDGARFPKNSSVKPFARCRRQDSNLRHADYDSAALTD